MIDTHTHIYFPDTFEGGPEATLQRALCAGISHMVLPNVDVDSVHPILALHRAFPEVTSVAVGLHPTEVKPSWRDDLREIRYRFADTPVAAWGEIGLDFHWDKDYASKQMDAFGFQLDEAFSQGLPAIIHSRDALDETLEVTRSMGERCPKLLFHSFTDTPESVMRILDAHPDALFGFNGVITFKNAPLVRDAAKYAGISRIVLETDAPYLAPVPKRGSTNESSFIPYILKTVADTCGVGVDVAEAATDANARAFFNLQS